MSHADITSNETAIKQFLIRETEYDFRSLEVVVKLETVEDADLELKEYEDQEVDTCSSLGGITRTPILEIIKCEKETIQGLDDLPSSVADSRFEVHPTEHTVSAALDSDEVALSTWSKQSCKHKQYQCGVCNFVSKTKSKLSKHLVSHDKLKIENTNGQSNVLKNKHNIRNIAGAKYSTKTHEEVVPQVSSTKRPKTKKNYSKCEYCAYRTKSQAFLVRHIMLVHKVFEPFKCDMCEFVSASQTALRSHMKRHDVKIFNCKKCRFSCNKQQMYTKHLAIHGTSRSPQRKNSKKCQYTCVTCKQPFKNKKALTQHQAIHTLVKPYKCDKCAYSCKKKWHLKSHMISHSPDRLYGCIICSYTAKRIGNLKQHVSVWHSAHRQRAHKCGKCDYACDRIRELNGHVTAASRDHQLHECDICGYKSCTKFNLVMHFKFKKNHEPK